MLFVGVVEYLFLPPFSPNAGFEPLSQDQQSNALPLCYRLWQSL